MCAVPLHDPATSGDSRPTPASTGGTLRWWCRLLWDIVRQRCPRCRRGRLFRGLFTMNDPCPVCGLLFQREEGYFLGAMYVSYFLGSALLIPFYFIAAALFPNLGSVEVALVAMLPYLPLTPGVFRYSRVVWVYLDRAADPTGINAGPYEKFRRSKLLPPDDTGSREPGTPD
jgi:uncharacterized protein (DUF983 family)